jgi:hypothetical protein
MHTKLLLKQYGPLFQYSRVCEAQALNSLNPAAFVSKTLQRGTRSQYKTLELLDLLLVFQWAKFSFYLLKRSFQKFFVKFSPPFSLFHVSFLAFVITHLFSFFPSQNIPITVNSA